MGSFMGYSLEKLLERAKKRGMTVAEYCKYLEMKKRRRVGRSTSVRTD